MMTNVDPDGRIFLSYPHTNDGFFFLLTTVGAWFNFDPDGEILLSYMDRLIMMDCFSPTFRRFFVKI